MTSGLKSHPIAWGSLSRAPNPVPSSPRRNRYPARATHTWGHSCDGASPMGVVGGADVAWGLEWGTPAPSLSGTLVGRRASSTGSPSPRRRSSSWGAGTARPGLSGRVRGFAAALLVRCVASGVNGGCELACFFLLLLACALLKSSPFTLTLAVCHLALRSRHLVLSARIGAAVRASARTGRP